MAMDSNTTHNSKLTLPPHGLDLVKALKSTTKIGWQQLQQALFSIIQPSNTIKLKSTILVLNNLLLLVPNR